MTFLPLAHELLTRHAGPMHRIEIVIYPCFGEVGAVGPPEVLVRSDACGSAALDVVLHRWVGRSEA